MYLAEFAYTAALKAKLDFRQVKTAVDYIASFDGFIKISYSASTVLIAIDIANEYNMPFWGSLLAATMKENGIFSIYTENTYLLTGFEMHIANDSTKIAVISFINKQAFLR